jgi:hypothetical protein
MSERHDRPLSPPGAEKMAQAYDRFEAWCRKVDPDGEMDFDVLLAKWATRDMEASNG